VFITVALLAGVAMIAIVASGASVSGCARDPTRDADTRILAERFAAGDLTTEQYRARVTQLDDGPPPARSWSVSGVAVTVVVIALVAVLLAIGAGIGPGWWGGMGGGHMGTSRGSGASAEPVTGATEVPVRAGDLWFEPDTLEVTAGDIVNVTVTNEGRILHDFTVPDLDFMIDVESGDTVSGALEAVTPGEYEFLCTVPGHAAAGMVGTLVVSEP
jgi:uncharacterized cupredoxin-like copper-binding protein